MLMVPATRGLIGAPRFAPSFTVQPYITGASVGGDQEATWSDTLTVNFVVIGAPPPAITFQWYQNFYTGGYEPFPGVTTQSILVGQAIFTLGTGQFGPSIFCTVQANNFLGTVSADTANMPVAAGG